MWFHINLCGIEVHFRICNYEPSTEDDWYAQWCNVDFSFRFANYLNYHGESAVVLLYAEVESLETALTQLLRDQVTEISTLSFVEPDFKLFNIVSLTEKIVMSIVPYAESKNLEVTFDTTDEELFSFMDEILYERILLNLLSNSIKYSKDKGDINIYVNNVKDKVQIVVEDHGIGMNDEDLKIIFNRFERIVKTLS